IHKATALGSIKAIDGLLAQIQQQLVADPAHPCPVVTFGKDHYEHGQYGRIYTPVFTVAGWCDMSGNMAQEVPALPADGRAGAAGPGSARAARRAPPPPPPPRRNRNPPPPRSSTPASAGGRRHADARAHKGQRGPGAGAWAHLQAGGYLFLRLRDPFRGLAQDRGRLRLRHTG